MEPNTSRNIRLGLFVIAGILLLIIAFYLIGRKKNLFGNTFRLTARFYNVNGLTQGNNVRFAGIDVGTVETLEIESDSSVRVIMLLDKAVQRFIREGAVASVGTDGLMGNKLVNIKAGADGQQLIKEGDELRTLQPVEMDEMIRTLNRTNTNMALISSNLSDITGRFGTKNTFWKLLTDTLLAENIQLSVRNLKDLSDAGRSSAYHLKAITAGMAGPQSSIGRLATDTVLYGKIVRAVNALQRTSDNADLASGDLTAITRALKNGKGSAGRMLSDTLLAYHLDKSLLSIDSAALGFNENMKALQHTWPLKHYFKKKATKK